MAPPRMTKRLLKDTVKLYRKHGCSVIKSANSLGIPVSTFSCRLQRARYAGLLIDGVRERVLQEAEVASAAQSEHQNNQLSKESQAELDAIREDYRQGKLAGLTIARVHQACKDAIPGFNESLPSFKRWIQCPEGQENQQV